MEKVQRNWRLALGGLSPYAFSIGQMAKTLKKVLQILRRRNYIVTLTDSFGNNFVVQIILDNPLQ
ncbi:MAG: hypothetical protein IPG18_08600 [Saprospiraceae bacterium]|nr:hypothetical protein [Saprospiraceae bacterium]